MKWLVLAMLISSPALASNDFMCGLYRVQLNDHNEIQINGKDWRLYKTSYLAKDKYVHVFENESQIRITQKYRVAFRVNGKSSWNACVPLIFYGDRK